MYLYNFRPKDYIFNQVDLVINNDFCKLKNRVT